MILYTLGCINDEEMLSRQFHSYFLLHVFTKQSILKNCIIWKALFFLGICINLWMNMTKKFLSKTTVVFIEPCSIAQKELMLVFS